MVAMTDARIARYPSPPPHHVNGNFDAGHLYIVIIPRVKIY